MNQNLTEVVFILDRSGSMTSLASDVIGGFNSYIEEQKKLPGDLKLTTVLFDDEYEVLHNGVDLKLVQPITSKEYFVRASTALLDALGKTINNVGARLANTKEDDRPSKVIVIIYTDGMENSSHEFTQSGIKAMVEVQRDVYKWEFIFLGANIDSYAVANSYGIQNSTNYSYSASGISSSYKTLSNVTRSVRSGGTVEKGWNTTIE